jgi:hypothetical protein
LFYHVTKGVVHVYFAGLGSERCRVADKVLLVEHGSVGAEECCRLTIGLAHVEHLQKDFFIMDFHIKSAWPMRKTLNMSF